MSNTNTPSQSQAEDTSIISLDKEERIKQLDALRSTTEFDSQLRSARKVVGPFPREEKENENQKLSEEVVKQAIDSASKNPTAIDIYRGINANRSHLDLIPLAAAYEKETNEEKKEEIRREIIYLQQQASFSEMMALNLENYMNLMEMYKEVRGRYNQLKKPLDLQKDPDMQRQESQAHAHFRMVNRYSSMLVTDQKKLTLLQEQFFAADSKVPKDQARIDEIDKQYMATMAQMRTYDEALDKLLVCNEKVSLELGGNHHGFLPVSTLIAQMLKEMDTKIQGKLERLSNVGKRIRELPEAKWQNGDKELRSPAVRGRMFDKWQQELQSNLTSFLKVSNTMGQHHTLRAKVATIRDHFGTMYRTDNAKGEAFYSDPDQRKKAMATTDVWLRDRAKNSIRNISDHLKAVKAESMTRASSEDQFVANLAERLSAIHSMQYPPHIAAVAAFRRVLQKENYRRNIYAVVGWPTKDGDPVPFDSLNPLQQSEISKKLRSVQDQYRAFIESSVMSNLEETLAAVRLVQENQERGKEGWTPKDLMRLKEIPGMTNRISTEDIENCKNADDAAKLMQRVFEQLAEDWAKYHHARSELLKGVYRTIGLHYETQAEQQMASYDIHENQQWANNALQFGLMGGIIGHAAWNARTMHWSRMRDPFRRIGFKTTWSWKGPRLRARYPGWEKGMSYPEYLASKAAERLGQTKNAGQWAAKFRQNSELLRKLNQIKASGGKLTNAQKVQQLFLRRANKKLLTKLAQNAGLSGGSLKIVLKAKPLELQKALVKAFGGNKAQAAKFMRAMMKTRGSQTAARQTVKVGGKWAGRAVPVTVGAYYLWEMGKKLFVEAPKVRADNSEKLNQMAKELDGHGFEPVDGDPLKFKHTKTGAIISLKAVEDGLDANVGEVYGETVALGVGLGIIGVSFYVGGPIGVVIAIGGILVEIVIEYSVGQWKDMKHKDFILDAPPWLLMVMDVVRKVDPRRGEFVMAHEMTSGFDMTKVIEAFSLNLKTDAENELIVDKILFSLMGREFNEHVPGMLREIFPSDKFYDSEYINEFFEGDFRTAIMPFFYASLRRELLNAGKSMSQVSNITNVDLLKDSTSKKFIRRALRDAMTIYKEHIEESRYVQKYTEWEQQNELVDFLQKQDDALNQKWIKEVALLRQMEEGGAKVNELALSDQKEKVEKLLERMNVLYNRIGPERDTLSIKRDVLDVHGDALVFGHRLKDIDINWLKNQVRVGGSRAMDRMKRMYQSSGQTNKLFHKNTPADFDPHGVIEVMHTMSEDYLKSHPDEKQIQFSRYSLLNKENKTIDGKLVKGRVGLYAETIDDPVLAMQLEYLYIQSPDQPGFKSATRRQKEAIASIVDATLGIYTHKRDREIWSRAYGLIRDPVADEADKRYVRVGAKEMAAMRLTMEAESYFSLYNRGGAVRNRAWEKRLFGGKDRENPLVLTSIARYKAIDCKDEERKRRSQAQAEDCNRKIEIACRELRRRIPKDHPVFNTKNLTTVVFQERSHARGKYRETERWGFLLTKETRSQDYMEKDHVILATFVFTDPRGNSYIMRNSAHLQRNSQRTDEINIDNLNITYGDPVIGHALDFPKSKMNAAMLANIERQTAKRLTQDELAIAKERNESAIDLPGFQHNVALQQEMFEGERFHPLVYTATPQDEKGGETLSFHPKSPEFQLCKDLVDPGNGSSIMPYERAPDAVFIEFDTSVDGKMTAIATYVNVGNGRGDRKHALVRRRTAVARRTRDDWSEWTHIKGAMQMGRFKNVPAITKRYGSLQKIAADVFRDTKERNSQEVKNAIVAMQMGRNDGAEVPTGRYLTASYDPLTGETRTRYLTRLASGETVMYEPRRQEYFLPKTKERYWTIYRKEGDKRNRHDTGLSILLDYARAKKVTKNGVTYYVVQGEHRKHTVHFSFVEGKWGWRDAGEKNFDDKAFKIDGVKDELVLDDREHLNSLAKRLGAIPGGNIFDWKREKRQVRITYPNETTNGSENFLIHSPDKNKPDMRVTLASASELMQSGRFSYNDRERIIQLLTTPLPNSEASIRRIIQLFPYEVTDKGLSSADILSEHLVSAYEVAADKQVFLRELFESMLDRGRLLTEHVEDIGQEHRITLNPTGPTLFEIDTDHNLRIEILKHDKVRFSVVSKNRVQVAPKNAKISLNGVPSNADGTYGLYDIMNTQKNNSIGFYTTSISIEAPGVRLTEMPIRLLNYRSIAQKRDENLANVRIARSFSRSGRDSFVRTDYDAAEGSNTAFPVRVHIDMGPRFRSSGARGSFDGEDGEKRHYKQFGRYSYLLTVRHLNDAKISTSYFSTGKQLRYRTSRTLTNDEESALLAQCGGDRDLMKMNRKLSETLFQNLIATSAETNPENEEDFYAPVDRIINLFPVDERIAYYQPTFRKNIRQLYKQARSKLSFLSALIRSLEKAANNEGILSYEKFEERKDAGGINKYDEFIFGRIEREMRHYRRYHLLDSLSKGEVVGDELVNTIERVTLVYCRRAVDQTFDFYRYDEAFSRSSSFSLCKKIMTYMLLDVSNESKDPASRYTSINLFMADLAYTLGKAKKASRVGIVSKDYLERQRTKGYKFNYDAIYEGWDKTLQNSMNWMISQYGISDSTAKLAMTFHKDVKTQRLKNGELTVKEALEQKSAGAHRTHHSFERDGQTYRIYLEPKREKYSSVLARVRREGDTISEDWDISNRALKDGKNVPFKDRKIRMIDFQRPDASEYKLMLDNNFYAVHLKLWRILGQAGSYFAELTTPYSKEAGKAENVHVLKELLDLCDHQVDLKAKKYWKVEFFNGIKDLYWNAKDQRKFLSELVSVLSGNKRIFDHVSSSTTPITINAELTSKTVPILIAHFKLKSKNGRFAK